LKFAIRDVQKTVALKQDQDNSNQTESQKLIIHLAPVSMTGLEKSKKAWLRASQLKAVILLTIDRPDAIL